MTLLPGKKPELHADLEIYGKVQGVFFRKSANLKAEGLALRGFVKNQADGSVRVELEGYEDSINQFIAWVKSSPAPTEVLSVEITWSDKLKNFRTFTIK